MRAVLIIFLSVLTVAIVADTNRRAVRVNDELNPWLNRRVYSRGVSSENAFDKKSQGPATRRCLGSLLALGMLAGIDDGDDDDDDEEGSKKSSPCNPCDPCNPGSNGSQGSESAVAIANDNAGSHVPQANGGNTVVAIAT